MIEQLFSLDALLPLLKSTEAFRKPLQYAESHNLVLRSMDDLEACVQACVHQQQQQQGKGDSRTGTTTMTDINSDEATTSRKVKFSAVDDISEFSHGGSNRKILKT